MYHVFQWLVLVVMTVAAFAAMGSADAAFEVALPDVGSEIQYGFTPPNNVFTIAANVSPSTILEGKVAFGDGKFLRKVFSPTYASEDFVELTLNLHGEDLRLALNDELRAFDEQASLLRPDGSAIQTVQNSSYGYYINSDDTFIFSWDFHSLGTLDIGGFTWRITPDVLPGRQLPETMSADFYMWGSRLVVVPEPTTASTMANALVAAGLMLHGRRRKV